MEIDVEIIEKDYKDYLKYLYKVKKTGRRLRLVFYFVVVGLVLIVNYQYLSNIPYILYLLAVYSLVYFLLFKIIRPITIHFSKYDISKKGSILGTRKHLVLEDGLRTITKNCEDFVKWQAFHSFEEDKKYFYLFIDKQVAYILPKRYFKSIEIENKFKIEIKSKIKLDE